MTHKRAGRRALGRRGAAVAAIALSAGVALTGCNPGKLPSNTNLGGQGSPSTTTIPHATTTAP